MLCKSLLVILSKICLPAFEYPLHEAAHAGEVTLVRSLIQQGYPVNEAYIGDQSTPLHRACLAGHVRCSQALIAAGANVSRSAANMRSSDKYLQ